MPITFSDIFDFYVTVDILKNQWRHSLQRFRFLDKYGNRFQP